MSSFPSPTPATPRRSLQRSSTASFFLVALAVCIGLLGASGAAIFHYVFDGATWLFRGQVAPLGIAAVPLALLAGGVCLLGLVHFLPRGRATPILQPQDARVAMEVVPIGDDYRHNIEMIPENCPLSEILRILSRSDSTASRSSQYVERMAVMTISRFLIRIGPSSLARSWS